MGFATFDQLLGHARPAGDNLDKPLWKVGKDLHELQGRDAGLLMGFDDDRVPGRERCCKFPTHEDERKIEGEDDDDRAKRLLDRIVQLARYRRSCNTASIVTAQFSVVVNSRCTP